MVTKRWSGERIWVAKNETHQKYTHYHKNENVIQAHNEVEGILMWRRAFEFSCGLNHRVKHFTNAIADGKLCLIDWKAYATQFFSCLFQTTHLPFSLFPLLKSESNQFKHVRVCAGVCIFDCDHMWFDLYTFSLFVFFFIVVSTMFSTQMYLLRGYTKYGCYA